MPTLPASEISAPALARLESEAIELTRSLLRIDSVNTGVAETIGDGETRAARFVQERLDEAGVTPRRTPSHEVIEHRPALRP